MENEKDESTKKSLDNFDVLIIFILTAVSFIIRYWRISLPPTTVFDEVYFGNFSNYYIQSQFFYDIHPPLAKILMYYIANLSEYDGSMSFKFNAKGYPLPDYVQLRLTPATFSALVFPLIYLSMRFSNFSHISSLCASLLALCDTSLATEGRHILTDGILHFFTILHVAVLSYTLSLKPRERATTKFYIWHILTGITLGCACSCKNTAWGLTVFDAFCYTLQFTDIISVQNFRLKKTEKNREKSGKFKKEKNNKNSQLLADYISSSKNLLKDDQTENKTVSSPINFSPKIDTNNDATFSIPKTANKENESSNFTIINDDGNGFDLTNSSGLLINYSDHESKEKSNVFLYDKIYSNSKEDDQTVKNQNESNLSLSPLDIQSSIQSSIINVFDGFDTNFDDWEFIRKEGTGGGILDFLFDVAVFGLTLAVIGLAVYCFSFYVHFILLPFAGKGTGFLQPNMKKQLISNKCATCIKPNVTHKNNQLMRASYDEFYDECVNSALYGVRVKKPSLFERTFILTFRMHTGNMRIVGFHDSQSFPWHWPVLSSVSTYFWGMNGKEIRCLGNAIVYYLVLFALIICTLYVAHRSFALLISLVILKVRSKREEKGKDDSDTSLHFVKSGSKMNLFLKKIISKIVRFYLSLDCDYDLSYFYPFCNKKWLVATRFIVGYSVSYFPFYWIPRTLYLYHYLIPLIFGCLSFGSMAELFLPMRYRSVFVVFVCIAAAFGFWLWSPYVYGTDKHDPDMMIWTRRWIDGDEQHKKAKLENQKKKK